MMTTLRGRTYTQAKCEEAMQRVCLEYDMRPEHIATLLSLLRMAMEAERVECQIAVNLHPRMFDQKTLAGGYVQGFRDAVAECDRNLKARRRQR